MRPHAAEVRALFGTTTLPSGFTRLAELETVFQGIKQRNPKNRVRLIRSDGTTMQTYD